MELDLEIITSVILMKITQNDLILTKRSMSLNNKCSGRNITKKPI